MINVVHKPFEKKCSILLPDMFDYSLHREFRKAYKSITEAGTKFHVDLTKVTFLDSSALGMLLLLKEHADELGGNTVLINPGSTVRRTFEIAKFDHLFQITTTS